jgi:phenylacetate-CoA ligase
MPLKEIIYEHSPIFMQNLMATIYGYKVRRERYGEEYYSYKRFLVEAKSMSRQELEKYQLTELKKLLDYSIVNSRFYRNLYSNINIQAIKSLEDIKVLPIVTKEMLRENIKDIVTVPKSEAIEGHTGGTTGKSLIVYFTRRDFERRMAFLDSFKENHGFQNIVMKRATFNGKHIVPQSNKKPIYWRYNAAIKQMVYSSFHLTEETIPLYINSLNDFQPDSIDGFISAIYEIASYVLRNNISLAFKPKAVFPTSETVHEHHRKIIEQAFGCKVRDQYASSEGAPFITECPAGKLHYEQLSGIFERISPDSTEVVITSFTTYGTPLIRYQIGDSIEFESHAICECGVQSLIVKNISGRSLDFLYAANGAKINSANIANIFKNVPNVILKAQLIQEKLGEIIVKIVPDKNNYRSLYDEMLINEIKYKFGKTMNVVINKVDDIPRERSGKYKLVINNIDAKTPPPHNGSN